jgi:hypothetical protein
MQDREHEHAFTPRNVEDRVREASQKRSPCLAMDKRVAERLLGNPRQGA